MEGVKRMRIRSILLAGIIAGMGLIPATSRSAPQSTTSLYSAKGQLTVAPPGAEKPGAWAISGSLALTQGLGKVPKAGTFAGSGPYSPSGVSTGQVSINWSDGRTSHVTVVIIWTPRAIDVAGVIRSGYARNSVTEVVGRKVGTCCGWGGWIGNLLVGLISPSM